MGLVPPLEGEKLKKLERTLNFYISIFYTMSLLISIVNNAKDKHADGLQGFKVAKYEPNPQRGMNIVK